MTAARLPRLPAPKLGATTLRDVMFPWAIALATGLDYFDNSIFSFFTSYIAGGINSSTDELVWASSAYAVASVLGILQQQWWIERLGNRRYIGGSLFLFAAGAIAATLCESSFELALARGFQGYFIGPMMSACRILIQMRFTPQQRPRATRAFLNMILLGSALAPLIGGYLVASFGWRALFTSTAIAGAACGLFVLLAVPSSGRVQPEARGEAHFWPYIMFAFAQGALQIVMQQVRFQLFSSSPLLIMLTAAGLFALGWFVWHQWHHPRPLIRLHALREKPFRVGIMLYIAFYYVNTTLSFLVSRFLEGGLHYPVENAGRLTGCTSLVALAAAYLYFRYSARVAHKKWLIGSNASARPTKRSLTPASQPLRSSGNASMQRRTASTKSNSDNRASTIALPTRHSAASTAASLSDVSSHADCGSLRMSTLNRRGSAASTGLVRVSSQARKPQIRRVCAPPPP